MWPDDGLEVWEQDGYAEAMYEHADNARKAARENRVGGSAPSMGANPSPAVPLTDTTDTDSGLAKDARSAREQEAS